MFRSAGITQKGFEMIAEAVSGKQLTFTRMEYGDGINGGLQSIVSDEETLKKYQEEIKKNPLMSEEEILNLLRTEKTDFDTKTLFLDVTELVSKKADIGMYEIKTDSGITTLTGKVIDSSVVKDFRARELGVFAKVDDGEEFLFAYFSAVDYLSGEINDSSDFISIPALLGQEQVIIVNVATGSATNIKMQYNINIYATKKEFDETVAKLKNQIAIEVANIIAEAPESFDTLKEISDWIATHEDSAAAMNSKIVQNQNDIKSLQSLIGKVAGYVPVGTILSGLYTTAPEGFLLCNGQEVAIADYPELYAVIGSLECCQSENEGMFKVPDLQDRFLQGANGNLGNRIEAGLPDISGYLSTGFKQGWEADGAFYFSGTPGPRIELTDTDQFIAYGRWYFSARKSSPIYGKSTTVQPPALTVNYVIKY